MVKGRGKEVITGTVILLIGIAIGTLAGVKFSARVYGSHLAIQQDGWKSMAQTFHGRITDLEAELYCCDECVEPEHDQSAAH